MGVEEIVSVSISLSAVNPSRQSFGIGLMAAYHNQWADRVRQYSNLPAVAVDFPAASTAAGCKAVYTAAAAYFSDTPSPAAFKVGRRSTSVTQSFSITVNTFVTGAVIGFEREGSSTSFAVTASQTNTTLVATQLLPLLAVGGTSTATQAGAVITLTSLVPGKFLDLGSWDRTQLSVKNTTVDAGVTGDLTAIAAADSQFYGFGLDNQSSTAIAQAAAWAETQAYKELFFDTCDADVVSATTTDICTTLKTAAYTRTVPLFDGIGTALWSGFGLMAQSLVNDPGSYTLNLMTLGGIATDTLTDNEASVAQGKNCNVYRTIENLNVITKGTNSSGTFEDTIRFRDWLKNEIQTRVLIVLKGSKKIPYTVKGIRAVGSAIQSALTDGIRVGGLSDDADAINTVVLPTIASISPSDRTARNLPNVTFKATEAGAIQSANIQGVLTA